MNPIDNRATANMMLSHEDEILLATTIAALDPAVHINASIIEQQRHRNLGLVVAAAAAAASAAIHATVPAPPLSSAPAGDARHEDIRHIRLHHHLHNALSPLDVPTTNAFGMPLTANSVGHNVMHVPWNNTLSTDGTPFTSAYSHSEQLVGDHCPVIAIPDNASNPLTSTRALAAAQGNVDDQTIDILLSPIPAYSRREDTQGGGIQVMINKRCSAPQHFRDEPANYNQPTIERTNNLPSGERRSAHFFQPYQLSRVRQGATSTAASSSSARNGNIPRARRLYHLAASEPATASRPPNQPLSASVILPIAMSDEAAQHVVVPIAPPNTASFSFIAGPSASADGHPMSNVQQPSASANSNTARQHSAAMALHRSLYQGSFPLDSVGSDTMNPSHGVTRIPSPLMVPPVMTSSSVEGFQPHDSHPHQCRLDHHYHHQLAFRQHCPSANAATAAHIPSTPPHRSLHQSQGPTLMPNTLQSYALLNSIAGVGCPALATSSYASGAHSIYDRPSSNFHQVDSRLQSFNALGEPPGSGVNHGRNAQYSSRGVQQLTPTVNPLNFLHSAVLADRLRQQEEERQRSIEFYQQLHAIQQQRSSHQQTGYGSGRLLRLPPPMMLAHASIAMPPVSVVPQPVELMVIPPSTAEVATAAHIVLNGMGIGIDTELSHHHASVGFRQASAVAAAAGVAVVEPQPVGISPEKIEKHSNRVNYISADEKTGTERERCTVCLVDFEKADELRSLRCSHMFHVECIDRWLIYNKKCPICRVDMDRPKAAQSDPCNPTPSAAVFRRAI